MSTARIDELRAKFDENPRRYFAPLANEYRKAGDLTQAIALCREHLPKQPGHMSGHIVFGQALFESGELSEAQTVFQSALDLDPENLIALRHLGDIARASGDDPLARRWYERVLDADPRNNDIASLLSTLSARLTPQAMTPVSVPVVHVESPTLDLDAMSDADESDDPFSSPDSPAWHTPSFLTPLASAVVPDEAQSNDSDVADSVEVAAGFDATDMSGASDGYGASDDTSSQLHVHPAHGDEHESHDLLDLDFSVGANDSVEYAAGSELISEGSNDARDGNTDDVIEASNDTDVLSAALGAFASHDLEDAETDAPAHVQYGNEAPQSSSDTASFDDADELEEGLVALEWPDTSAITTRVPTPAHAELPIVLDTYDDAMPAVSEVAHDSFVSAQADVVSDSFVGAEADVVNDSFVGAEADVVSDAFVGAEVDDVEDSFVGAEAGVVSDSSIAAHAVEVDDLTDDVLSEAHADVIADAELLSVADSHERADTELNETELDETELETAIDDTAIEDDAGFDSGVLVSLDDTVAVQAHVALEDEIDADIDDQTDDDAVLDDSDDDAFEGVPEYIHADLTEEEYEPEQEPAAQPTAAPAFVTETMAELLVAQGFVGRAAEVYEELIARRPYDEVLTFRLQELRGMLAAEQPSDGNASFVATDSSAHSATPVMSATAVGNVAAISPDASPSRRSARELFASLATMRVARRTPAFGSATVAMATPAMPTLALPTLAMPTPAMATPTVQAPAMPTPADGLASLFGESPTEADDHTARAMARAFGDGEGVEAGPSMFTPSTETDTSRSRPTPASVPPVPSGPAFSFDRFFPDPATTNASGHTADNAGSSQAQERAVASGSGEAPAAGPSSAGADLAHFSQWLKGLSNS